MNLQLVIDMNLSAEWVDELFMHGWHAVHWSTVGDPRADDAVIMEWARNHNYVVLTHDLDFGALLAQTRGNGPSVLQLRGEDVSPEELGTAVVSALVQFKMVLLAGALVVVDTKRTRARVLPLFCFPSPQNDLDALIARPGRAACGYLARSYSSTTPFSSFR